MDLRDFVRSASFHPHAAELVTLPNGLGSLLLIRPTTQRSWVKAVDVTDDSTVPHALQETLVAMRKLATKNEHIHGERAVLIQASEHLVSNEMARGWGDTIQRMQDLHGIPLNDPHGVRVRFIMVGSKDCTEEHDGDAWSLYPEGHASIPPPHALEHTDLDAAGFSVTTKHPSLPKWTIRSNVGFSLVPKELGPNTHAFLRTLPSVVNSQDRLVMYTPAVLEPRHVVVAYLGLMYRENRFAVEAHTPANPEDLIRLLGTTYPDIAPLAFQLLDQVISQHSCEAEYAHAVFVAKPDLPTSLRSTLWAFVDRLKCKGILETPNLARFHTVK